LTVPFKQMARMGYDPLTELRASHKALFGSELRCPTPIPPPATPLGDDELESAWCRDQEYGRTDPNPAWGQATRT